jgi:ketosteroid isomerase-like protein
MSQENVELIRRGFAAFERGDVTEMLDLMADDLLTYRADPDAATFHGKEGFLEATADWTEGFTSWSVTPEEFIDAGRCVVVRVRQTARVEGSDVSVASKTWFVYELRRESVSKLSFYSRREEALVAAGLAE